MRALQRAIDKIPGDSYRTKGQACGITYSRLQQLYVGKHPAQDDEIAKIAAASNTSAIELLANNGRETAKTHEAQELWTSILKKVAASIAIGGFATLLIAPDRSDAALHYSTNSARTDCILCQIKKAPRKLGRHLHSNANAT